MRFAPKGTLVFNTLLLVTMAGMLWTALQPGYAGGRVVGIMAGFTTAVLLVVMVRDHLLGAVTQARGDRVAVGRGVPGGAQSSLPEWLAVGYVGLLFALVYVLGTLAGCVVFIAAFLLIHHRRNLALSLALAVLVGGGFPYFLGAVLGLQLWEGVIPTVVPGYIGGGLPPSL